VPVSHDRKQQKKAGYAGVLMAHLSFHQEGFNFVMNRPFLLRDPSNNQEQQGGDYPLSVLPQGRQRRK